MALNISFPLANITNEIKIKNPVTWAYSINLSDGLLPVAISYNKNITCPPSKAGIGNKLSTPSIIDKNAVIDQKSNQLKDEGNIFPIAINPPRPL